MKCAVRCYREASPSQQVRLVEETRVFGTLSVSATGNSHLVILSLRRLCFVWRRCWRGLQKSWQRASTSTDISQHWYPSCRRWRHAAYVCSLFRQRTLRHQSCCKMVLRSAVAWPRTLGRVCIRQKSLETTGRACARYLPQFCARSFSSSRFVL